MTRALLTIGYEGATLDAVLGTLQAARVELLVDVRAVAASRRPGFSKRQLAAGLEGAGIGYLHLRSLGTPAEGRQAARVGRHDELRRIYEAHLATAVAREGLAELEALVAAGGRRVCLLCFERDAAGCHRSMVAERLGVGVEHLHP